jgi:hypothetical protein
MRIPSLKPLGVLPVCGLALLRAFNITFCLWLGMEYGTRSENTHLRGLDYCWQMFDFTECEGNEIFGSPCHIRRRHLMSVGVALWILCGNQRSRQAACGPSKLLRDWGRVGEFIEGKLSWTGRHHIPDAFLYQCHISQCPIGVCTGRIFLEDLSLLSLPFNCCPAQHLVIGVASHPVSFVEMCYIRQRCSSP